MKVVIYTGVGLRAPGLLRRALWRALGLPAPRSTTRNGLVRLLIASSLRYIGGPLLVVPPCFSFAFYEHKKLGAKPPGPLAAHITG